MTDPSQPPPGRRSALLAHLLTAPVAALASLASGTALIWAPMALRWPLRILFVLGLLVIVWSIWARLKQAPTRQQSRTRAIAPPAVTAILTGLILISGKPAWDLRHAQAEGRIRTPSITAAAERAAELAALLKPRGIQLAVVALPTYQNLFPASRKANALPDPAERRAVRGTLENLRRAGIPAYDAEPLFLEHAADPALWEDDTAHLRIDPMTRLAGALADQLEQWELGPGADGARKVVFMGNCFAGDFAELTRKHQPEWRQLRGLSALGDESRVADLLFLFPNEYLDGTGLVVWMMHYPRLTGDAFPPIESEPDLTLGAPRTANVRVQTALGWDDATQKSRPATLPYPNGLVHLSATILESPDFPAGQTVHFIGYAVTERQITALGRVKAGKRLSVNLLPLDAYQARHPKVASDPRLNAGPEDLDAVVYWLDSWTFIR